jgi:purine-binding chemotaxis protein CheW
MMTTTQDTDTVQFTTFFIGEELFGLDALRVHEILSFQTITTIPLAPEYVKGMMNLRGQILTVIDLGRRLGMPTAKQEEEGTNLIVESGDGQLSLFVDEIGGIIDVRHEQLLPPPGNVRGIAAEYIQGVCQLEENLLIVLNTDSVLQRK